MIHTADYHIGDVPLLFNSWTFRQYCRRVDIDLDQLFEHIGQGERVIKTDHMPDLLYVAAESWCRFNNKTFTYTELDAYTWVDTMGGYRLNEQWSALVKVFMMKLLNIPQERFEVLWAGEEQADGGKKKAAKGSPGTASTKKASKRA